MTQEYLEKFKIKDLFTDLLNTLIENKPQKPLQFLVDFLQDLINPSQNICTNKQLAIQYQPKLFKKQIPIKIFQLVKNNIQMPNYITIRDFFKFQNNNPNHKTGLFAINAKSYKIFYPLFKYILGQNNHEQKFNNLFIGMNSIQQEMTGKIIIRRNIKDQDYGIDISQFLKSELTAQEFINDKFKIYLGQEEHLKFEFNIKKGLSLCLQIQDCLQEINNLQLDYDFDQNFGYLQKNTKYCGHGIKIKLIINKWKNKKPNQNQNFIFKIQNKQLLIKTQRQQNQNINQLCFQLDQLLQQLSPSPLPLNEIQFKSVIEPFQYKPFYYGFFILHENFMHVSKGAFDIRKKYLQFVQKYESNLQLNNQDEKFKDLQQELNQKYKLDTVNITNYFESQNIKILCNQQRHISFIKDIKNHNIKQCLDTLKEYEKELGMMNELENNLELDIYFVFEDWDERLLSHYNIFQKDVKQKQIDQQLIIYCQQLNQKKLNDFEIFFIQNIQPLHRNTKRLQISQQNTHFHL